MLNLVLWAVQGQGLSPSHYGLAMGAAGLGGLLGTATALKLADGLGLGRAFAVSLVLSCGTPVLVFLGGHRGLTLGLLLAAVMFVSGVGLGNANVDYLTMRQTAIPESQLTRAAGAYTQLMYGSIPLGSAAAGLLGRHWGTHVATGVGALGMLASALPMFAPAILRLRHTGSLQPQD